MTVRHLTFVVVLAALTGTASIGPVPAADEPRGMAKARAAVADLRARTFLPSKCEQAFGAFWQVYAGAGPEGLVRWPGTWREETYFGYGNTDAASLLPAAIDTCADETGVRGDLVLRVLRDREQAKRDRAAEIRRAARAVTGY